MLYLRFILLVLACWFTNVNIITGVRGQQIPAINFIIQAVAIAGLIASYGFLS